MICASGNAPDAGRFYRRYHPIRGPNMATAEEHLMDWLRDAHAMEEQAEKMLRATAGRLENYPDLKARLESHEIGRAHVRTPVTNAHLVCRLLLEKKKKNKNSKKQNKQ